MRTTAEKLPIFFSEPLTNEERQEQRKRAGIKHAKLTLINDIFKIKMDGGVEPNGRDFNTLYDMEIDDLFFEMIKEQDKTYNFNNPSRRY